MIVGWRAMLVVLVFAAGCTRRPDVLRATFLDVGQADCALLRTPDGRTVVVDTGSNGRAARMLREEGVREIDLLILSHPHDDHIGGVRGLAKAMKIRKVWHSGLDLKEPTRKLLASLPSQVVKAGDRTNISGMELSVLHPAEPSTRGNTENNNSLVIRAAHNGTSYLFTGDCELECWDALFRTNRSALRSDVLKAAHHGAENGTNSGVLINVAPKAFIISCGRNSYGHPDDLVLRMASMRSKVFRTDEMGTIDCLGAECRGSALTNDGKNVAE